MGGLNPFHARKSHLRPPRNPCRIHRPCVRPPSENTEGLPVGILGAKGVGTGGSITKTR